MLEKNILERIRYFDFGWLCPSVYSISAYLLAELVIISGFSICSLVLCVLAYILTSFNLISMEVAVLVVVIIIFSLPFLLMLSDKFIRYLQWRVKKVERIMHDAFCSVLQISNLLVCTVRYNFPLILSNTYPAPYTPPRSNLLHF